MVFTQFGDHISIASADAPVITVTGPQGHIVTGDLLSVERDSPNLIIKALYAMCDATGYAPNIHIALEKHIPAGAGLGGGSADAAAMMQALNKLWGNPLPDTSLAQIGLKLGAELPVCLAKTATRVQGIGDIITPVPHLPRLPVLIVWPDYALLTARVFKHYRESAVAFDRPLPDLPQNDDFETWVDYLSATTNGLTETATDLCSDIADIIRLLTAQKGCRLARMSGSGSASFGIFDTMDAMHNARRHFGDYHTAATHTL